MTPPLLLGHAVATLFMTGVIWIVQAVHYPLMADVGPERFPRYQRRHARRITGVVAPPMLVEAATAAMLVAQHPPDVPAFVPWVGMGLVGVIWVSTAFLQVPQHNALASDSTRTPIGGWWLRTGCGPRPGRCGARWRLWMLGQAR